MTFAHELWSALFLGIFTGLALPLIPIVARRIGMGPAGITAMLTMQFVGSLFGVVFGYLADRLPKMPFVVWPNAISRALIALLAFIKTPVPYLIVVSAYFLLMNLGGPAYASIMRSNYSDANRGRLMSNIRIAVVVVSTLFSALAGIILGADERIVRFVFPVAALFGVLSALSFGRVRVRRGPGLPPNTAHMKFRESFRIVRRNAPFMQFIWILWLCAMPDKLGIPLEPIWLVDGLHVGYQGASLLLGTVVSAVSIVGYFVFAKALKRRNSFAVLAVVVFLFAGRFAALGLAKSDYGLIPMSILSGLSNAGWDLVPIFCFIALAEPANFSLYMGVNTTLFGIRGIIGPSIGTLIYSSGVMSLPQIFLGIAAILAVGAVTLMLFSRKVPARGSAGIGALP